MNDPAGPAPSPASPPSAPAPPPPAAPPQPAAPPPAAAPRDVRRWPLDEWALGLLALFLAVLLWRLVHDGIEETRDLSVEILATTRSRDFVAFHDGKPVTMRLKGTKADLDAAAKSLGRIRTLEVRADDLKPEESRKTVTLEWRTQTPEADQNFAVPFARRLVVSVTPVTLEVFRRVRQTVPVSQPRFKDKPAGFAAEVEKIVPENVTEEAPAGMLLTLDPDPIDVGPLFADGRPPEGSTDFFLTFRAWREDPYNSRFRRAIVLPSVKATVRFRPEDEEDITNNILVYYPGTADDRQEDYEYKIDEASLPGYVKGDRFTGKFLGGTEDLQALKNQTEGWFYCLLISPDKLDELRKGSATEATVTASLRVVLLTDAVHRLAVKFKPPPNASEAFVTVRKKK